MKKLAIAVALCGSLICSPVHAKTFVGVLWPMFGPLPAIGLVELVGELKMMPDVEVSTYVHQAWPSLVDDIDRQPPGTHTVVVGYSLGANSSVFVANNAKYVDLIIALQPSLLSWNPPVTGKVGRMIEIYNPNPWMTFGGMGSRKLVGENIEYIANNDSHPGAQFNSEFRNLVKSEIAKFTAEDRLETAQAEPPTPPKLEHVSQPAGLEPAVERPGNERTAVAEKDRRQIAETEAPKSPKPAQAEHGEHVAQERLEHRPDDLATDDGLQTAQAEMQPLPKAAEAEPGADEQPKHRRGDITAFLDQLSTSVNSGDLLVQRQLTIEDLKDYAKRTYRESPTAGLTTTASNEP